MDTDTRGAGNEISFLWKHIYAPESNRTVNDIQNTLREEAVDAPKFDRQRELVVVVLLIVGQFCSRIGKASIPDDNNIGQYGQVSKNKIGAEMLTFLKNSQDEDIER